MYVAVSSNGVSLCSQVADWSGSLYQDRRTASRFSCVCMYICVVNLSCVRKSKGHRFR